MIEIPPKFAGQLPINPQARNRTDYNGDWIGAQGLAEDVKYYGEWMKQKAFERIGHLYPKVKDEKGQEHTVIAWIWARTVKCPNPVCGCEMPLASSFELSKKKGKEAYVQPIIEGNKIRYEVKYGKNAPEGSIINRRGARCVCCNNTIDFNYIRDEANNKRMSSRLVAIVAEGKNGRLYISPNEKQVQIADVKCPGNCPESDLPYKALGINIRAYGFNQHKDLFTNRQLTALTTFSDLVAEAQRQVITDGESEEYAQAVGVYLTFVIDKLADFLNTMAQWRPDVSKEQVGHLFSRQAIPMVWDYAEANPFSSSAGGWEGTIRFIPKLLDRFPCQIKGFTEQHDAQTDNGLRDIMLSTDPPYYDNIGYADLSDFFYVWMRRTLKNTYPDLFRTMLAPKAEELIANPFRFDGSKEKAKNFFEDGMIKTFKQVNTYVREDVPVTIYYAYKQSNDDTDDKTASTGWETMLSAIIQSDFSITGTWPMRTELGNRMRSVESNALATSVVLVCRKRPADAPVCTSRDFINALKRELRPALEKLQASNIAPVDLAQCAIGPGIGVYSRFSKVLGADGTPMGVRSALQLINQELSHYFTEQDDELDSDSRFCVDLYTQYAFNDVKFGVADVLARAKNTSVDKLKRRGVIYSERGIVRLLTREEILTETVDREIIWLLTQQLTRVMELGGVEGVAKIICGIVTSEPERAKALAYRLFTIAERKGWTQEACAYNSLVVAWPDVQSKAAELQARTRDAKQMSLKF
jgi:putative DNA methylase